MGLELTKRVRTSRRRGEKGNRGRGKGTNRGEIKEQVEKEQRDKGERALRGLVKRSPGGSSNVTFTPTESVTELNTGRGKKVERDVQRPRTGIPSRYRPPP